MTHHREKRRQPFSEVTASEAATVIQQATTVLKGRPDIPGITIDGPTSKDLDDAFWLERTPDGGYLLHVSIADVGSLISTTLTPAIEQAARKQAFTRYFSESNRPMLPRSISEEALSLLPGQARPAITITIPFDPQLSPGEPTILQTALFSRQRFSYSQVDAEIARPRTEMGSMLQETYHLAERLLHLRRLRGALAIYDLSTGWATTEEGLLHRLGEGERYKAQMIIQELMILTNQVFALFLAQRSILALYRNHHARPIAPARSVLAEMMDIAITHPAQSNPERIQTTVHLAMERATYNPTVEGHFGLNLPSYIHLTSPLRRYPDLLNQHILLAALKGDPPPYTKDQLETIAAEVNTIESEMKDAKSMHFRTEHDRSIQRTVAESIQTAPAAPVLDELDAKTFHSVLRIAAEGHILHEAVEQEIYRRLANQLLQANDLFTLLFRFENSGGPWDRLKAAIAQELQRVPHHATSILLMGQQALGWGAPDYDLSPAGYSGNFTACAKVAIAGQWYVSARKSATQKERAKQLANADLLARIVGVADALPVEHLLPDPVLTAPAHPILAGHNYKGQLQEVAQTQHWELPRYTTIEQTGSAHTPTFCVIGELSSGTQTYTATGRGPSKMEAEQDAAHQLLQHLSLPATPSPTFVSADAHPVSALNELKQKRAIQNVTYSYKPPARQSDGVFSCTCTVITHDGRTMEATANGATKKEAALQAAYQVVAALSNDRMDA